MLRSNLLRLFNVFLFSFSLITAQEGIDDFSESSGESRKITIIGTVVDSETGKGLAGANVVIDGTEDGAASDEEGSFSIENVEIGSGVTVSVIGYEDQTIYADVETIEFLMVAKAVMMSELEVLASRASEKTAVAYTDVTKEEIALRLGSQDIPLAMNLVPSVYATNQGGGAGDARINVRGFNQRNVAVMINGIPVNDMENGWVFWSNWDGVADVTSSIQMQKGLSAQNLATPSIGGSMNIVTDAAALERGGSFKQEVGAWGF